MKQKNNAQKEAYTLRGSTPRKKVGGPVSHQREKKRRRNVHSPHRGWTPRVVEANPDSKGMGKKDTKGFIGPSTVMNF